MTQVVSTWQHHGPSYTIPYTFKEGEWYVFSFVNEVLPHVTFLSGFTSHGCISGYCYEEYFYHGSYVYIGQATNSTVTIKNDDNYCVIMVGELSSE